MVAAVFAFVLVIAAQAQAEVPANGRSWELTTTPLPNSTSSGVLGIRPMGDDGEQVVYSMIGPPPGSPSGAALANGISKRGNSGWFGAPLGVAYNFELHILESAFAPILAVGFSEDLQSTLWASISPLTPGAPPEGQSALYRERGGVLELVSRTGTFRPLSYAENAYADISSDGNTVVFDSALHLLPADAARTEERSLYAWRDGNLQVVDVDDSGTLISTCGSTISKLDGVSASGNEVFFSVPASCNGVKKVYMRNLEKQTTVQISASRCTRVDCDAAADARFAGASSDGKFAYITTPQQLTNDDEDSRNDLYRYTVETGQLTLLSGGDPAATGSVIEDAPVALSEIGDRVYFGAYGELLPGESEEGQKLFLADASGVHFVAGASIPTVLGEKQIQLSRDGKRALFVTSNALLPGDTDSQGDAYLYDADTEELTLISAGSTGGNGAFPVTITAPSPLNQQEFESGNLRPYYAIDAAGDRTFFETDESLLPEDTNSKSDVYESWNGNLGLVTAGELPFRSDFAGVSRDGRSAMFATNATLLPSDRDGGARDLYTARLGGGFPEEVASPGCDSSSCPLGSQPRLARGVPPSALPQAKKAGRLRLVDVAPAAKGGAIAVDVSVPAPGTVTGMIWVRQKGKKLVLAKGSARAKVAGKLGLSLRLEPAARQGPKVIPKAHVTVSSGGAKVSEVVKVTLR